MTCSGYDANMLFGYAAKCGILHFKDVVIDGRIAYTGTRNVTKSARANRERMYRMEGPPVQEIMSSIHEMAANASAI